MKENKIYDINLTKMIISVLILIIGLIMLGALSFHLVEGWTYFDALYFTVATFSTIGYGDIVPVTLFGKILVMVYAFLGVPLFVALTTLFMERRFRNFIFDHFAHHSKKLEQAEKKLKKQLEEATQEIKDEAQKNLQQEKKLKKIEKKLQKEGIEEKAQINKKKYNKVVHLLSYLGSFFQKKN